MSPDNCHDYGDWKLLSNVHATQMSTLCHFRLTFVPQILKTITYYSFLRSWVIFEIVFIININNTL